MKRYIVFVLLMCLVLTGCGMKAEAPAVTAEPEVTEIPEALSQQVVPLLRSADTINGTLHVSLNEGAVYVNENDMPEMRVTFYDYELYDAVAMNALKQGDSILRLGQEVPVNSIGKDENGDIIINGGLDEGGHVFRPGDGGTYYEISYNDARVYAPAGELILPVADEFCFVDKSDLDKEPQSYYLDTFFVDGLFTWYFSPSNTTIQLDNGVVASMERVYIP